MKVLKKVIEVISTVMLVAFVILVLLLVGVRLVGLEPHVVVSGSMEPEILTGSMVYVKRVSPEEACALKEGETITYQVDAKGTKVTHKIYEVVGYAYLKDQYGELVLDANGEPIIAKDDAGYPIVMYTTYGINNKNSSEPSGYTLDGAIGQGNLASSNVFGKPVFTIPYLGYLAHFVQNPPGRYFAFAICALLIITTFWGGSSPKKEKRSQDGGEDVPLPSGDIVSDNSDDREDTPKQTE